MEAITIMVMVVWPTGPCPPSPVPVLKSFSQEILSLSPVVDVEGENSGVLREGPGHPDVAVILRHDQRDRHGQTNQRHQQPQQRGQ